jgi:eukaryotic-like serine/threonine-protein kinase
MTTDLRQGKVLQGRYRLTSLLAEGGMGVVYKGERVGIGRAIVVKFLHAVLSDKPGIVDRFEREARATARLNHPNCVALVDFGIDDSSPYLVMEYVEGKTLADLLDYGAIPPERAVHIILQILGGLEHAHDRGILHRDLKPANIMIVNTEGYPGDFVKILDFGLAKLAWPGEDGRDVTVEGIAIGTPGYMSPEQAAGVPSDRRSDIYCAGALLYHLVTGTKAFDGSDVKSVLRRHREETPQSPRELRPGAGISRELEDVLYRSMERDPTDRYQSAKEMASALRKTPEAQRRPEISEPVMVRLSRPPTATEVVTRAEAPTSRRQRRRSLAPVWLGLGLVVGAVATMVAVSYSPLGSYLRPTAAAPASARHSSPSRPAPSTAAPPAGKSVSAPERTPPERTSPERTPPERTPAPASPSPSGATPLPPGAQATPSAGAALAARTPPAGAPAADEEEDDVPGNDDGSNENDRTPPPEPAAAQRTDAPIIRSVKDARILVKKGETDAALAGLFRLRRAHPAPSAAKSSEIATLIGDLYFDRKWWTEALREYRFAIALDARAKRNDILVNNSVRALADRTTYPRARRLILDYVGRNATPALKRAAKSGATPQLRRRAQKVLATLESKSYRSRR